MQPSSRQTSCHYTNKSMPSTFLSLACSVIGDISSRLPKHLLIPQWTLTAYNKYLQACNRIMQTLPHSSTINHSSWPSSLQHSKVHNQWVQHKVSLQMGKLQSWNHLNVDLKILMTSSSENSTWTLRRMQPTSVLMTCSRSALHSHTWRPSSQLNEQDA